MMNIKLTSLDSPKETVSPKVVKPGDRVHYATVDGRVHSGIIFEVEADRVHVMEQPCSVTITAEPAG